MRLLAALCAALLAQLVVGTVLGIGPRRRTRSAFRVVGVRRDFQRWLDASGTHVSPESFIAVATASGSLAALVAASLGVPALAVLASIAGTLVPIVTVEHRRATRRRDRTRAWPDAVRDLTTHLRSGSSLHSALIELGRLGPVPLRSAFGRYQALAVALDHRAALEIVRSELADPLSDRIIEVLLVAFDQGTRVVVEVLDDLAQSAVDDVHLLADIETAQLEVTLEARACALLPFVVLGMLCAGSSGYRSFYASAAGSVVIAIGLALSLLGLGIIARLGRVRTEPRVLVEVTW